nr:N-acetylmuramoyl-L-alanine amidase [Maliibacterium massiliense]
MYAQRRRMTPEQRRKLQRARRRRVWFKRIRAVVLVALLTTGMIFLCRALDKNEQGGLVPTSDGKGGGTVQAADSGDAYGIPIRTLYVDKSSPRRPGIKRQIKYVVIHETGNAAAGTNAANHSNYLTTNTDDETGWHYTVDDHEIYHHIPDDEVAWHAGDLQKPGGGNDGGIGVELCVNQDGNFEKTFDNGAKLAAKLLKQYKLPISALKMHGDFTEKNCPEHIRDQGRWQAFTQKVQQYMAQ